MGTVAEFSIFVIWQRHARWQYCAEQSRRHPSVTTAAVIQTGGSCCHTISECETGARCRNSSPFGRSLWRQCAESTVCDKMMYGRASDNKWRSAKDQLQQVRQRIKRASNVCYKKKTDDWSNEMAHGLSLSHGTVTKMIVQFKCHKVCARWAPRALFDDHKAKRTAHDLSFW